MYTVKKRVYEDIFMAFMKQLDDIELTLGHFQQDGATCHTSNESMALINSFFVDRYLEKPAAPQVARLNVSGLLLVGLSQGACLQKQTTKHSGSLSKHHD
jgi:hypothetical protein